jgi:hypothetical protein
VHVAVVIEVLATQVGEGGDLEAHAGAALLVEGVRGHFHRHGLGAGVTELRELALQRHRVGRRVQARP